MSVPGWGGLEQRVQERQRETIQGLDANGTIQLENFARAIGRNLADVRGVQQPAEHTQFDPCRQMWR